MSENARNNGPIAEEESKDPINGGNFLIIKDVLSEIDKKPKTENSYTNKSSKKPMRKSTI